MKSLLQPPSICLIALLLLVVTTTRADDTTVPPNLIFILADDLGWRDLGCYGSTFHQTPHLDRLAARGVRLTQAYAASPLCSPTRASILTGLYPARIGITAPVCHLPAVQLEKRIASSAPATTAVLTADSITRLLPIYVTLAERLQQAGYQTAHFGKWHLGHNRPGQAEDHYEPRDQGFGLDFPHTPRAPGPGGGYLAPWKFITDPALPAPAGEHIDARMASEAARFIRTNKDQPFYINFWTYSVHSPWNAREADIEAFQSKVDPNAAQRNPLYAAMVKGLDESIGVLMNALQEAGVAERTIVVFFSDNGGFAYPPRATDPPGYDTLPATSNTPLRSGKASLYEGGTREPCLIVWPGRIAPGTTSDAFFSSVDWLPTLLSMCGQPIPSDTPCDGVDQRGTLQGQPAVRDTLFCHFPHGSPAQATVMSGFLPGAWVRRGDWKLIRFFAAAEDGSDRFELYNLREDLSESRNLADAEPERVKEWNRLLSQFLADTGATIPIRNPQYNPAARPTRTGPTSPASSAKADPLQGWKARGCTATVQNGVVTIRGENKAPFLGVGAGLTGPLTVRCRLRTPVRGTGQIEWLAPNSQPDPAHTAPFELQDGDWQTYSISVPTPNPIGILRLYLPAQAHPVELDWIELKSATRTRRWDF